jgi:hypothetical protein
MYQHARCFLQMNQWALPMLTKSSVFFADRAQTPITIDCHFLLLARSFSPPSESCLPGRLQQQLSGYLSQLLQFDRIIVVVLIVIGLQQIEKRHPLRRGFSVSVDECGRDHSNRQAIH